MKKYYLIFLFLLIAQTLFSQTDNRIENIGKQTSELLIEGKNIDNFKYAIRIKSLYPNEDFSKFEDSPAALMLGMLYGNELELPIIWTELLKIAHQYKIDKNSNYINTYYYKMGVDNHIVSSVIKSQSKYYVFSYNLLEWEKDIYISRFYKEIKEFESIEDIESNPFIIIDNEIQKELNEIDDIVIPE